jgi:hypothetical protein
MAKKVLIIGPDTGGIPQSVAKAFCRLGWQAEPCLYLPPVIRSVGRLIVNRLRDPYCDKAFRREFNRVIRERVLQILGGRSVDLILVLKGDYLEETHAEALCSSGIPLVLWTLDSVARAPAQKILAEMALHSFYIDGGDLLPGDARGTWLPLGFDADIYRPESAPVKGIDVLLIGSLGDRYTRRLACLERLRSSPLARKWRCGFVGSPGTLSGNLALKLRYGSKPKEGVAWLSRRIPAAQLARAIAGARICLNIHQDDGLMPINPMFFAIPGSGTCQVAEQKPHLAKWLRPGLDYAAFAEETFLDDLGRLLESPRELARISREGELASSQHTYERRVATILDRIGGP